jgi:hypothetical protein
MGGRIRDGRLKWAGLVRCDCCPPCVFRKQVGVFGYSGLAGMPGTSLRQRAGEMVRLGKRGEKVGGLLAWCTLTRHLEFLLGRGWDGTVILFHRALHAVHAFYAPEGWFYRCAGFIRLCCCFKEASHQTRGKPRAQPRGGPVEARWLSFRTIASTHHAGEGAGTGQPAWWAMPFLNAETIAGAHFPIGAGGVSVGIRR